MNYTKLASTGLIIFIFCKPLIMLLKLILMFLFIGTHKEFIQLPGEFVTDVTYSPTISFQFLLASLTTNKEHMTSGVLAVHIVVTFRRLTHLTHGYDFISNLLPHSLIKNEILATKFILQT